MTDLEGGEAATGEDTTTAPEAVVSSQETERDYEAEAREMGWVPETEWKGDRKPVKFLSAEEFVERGETMIPILNKRLADMEKRFEKLSAMSEKTVERLKAQHAKELSDLKAQRREAVKAGDVETVDQLDEQIEKHRADEPEEKPEDAQAVQEAWIAKHDWWETDEDMTAYAIGISQGIAAKHLRITMAENLAKTEEALKKKYPEKFGITSPKKTSANGHALVDGGGSFPGAGKPKNDAFSKLPSEAKAQCQKDIAAGLYKNEAAWIAVYNS